MAIPFDAAEIAAKVEQACAEEMRDAAEVASRVTILNNVVGNPDLWASPAPPDYRPGGARAGWNIVIGREPGEEIYDPEIRDTVGAPTLARAISQIRTYGRRAAITEQVIYLANAVPYIVPLNAGLVSRQGSFFAEAGVDAAAQAGQGSKPL